MFWKRVAPFLVSSLLMMVVGSNAQSEEGQQKIDPSHRLIEMDNELSYIALKLRKIRDEIASAEERLIANEENILRVDEKISLLTDVVESRVAYLYFLQQKDGDIFSVAMRDINDYLHHRGLLKTLVANELEALTSLTNELRELQAQQSSMEQNLSELKDLEVVYLQTEQQFKRKLAQRERLVETDGLDSIEIRQEQRSGLLQLLESNKNKYADLIEKYDQSFSEERVVWSPPLDPDTYSVSSRFGLRKDPIDQTNRFHYGIDLAAPKGTDIMAAHEGVVLLATYLGGYGNVVAIYHGGDYFTLYGHLDYDGIFVQEGDEVMAGQIIGIVGATGNATGPHLHFEAIKDNARMDPAHLLHF